MNVGRQRVADLDVVGPLAAQGRQTAVLGRAGLDRRVVTREGHVARGGQHCRVGLQLEVATVFEPVTGVDDQRREQHDYRKRNCRGDQDAAALLATEAQRKPTRDHEAHPAIETSGRRSRRMLASPVIVTGSTFMNGMKV